MYYYDFYKTVGLDLQYSVFHILNRGAGDKVSGRIIRSNSWFSDYPVFGRIFLVIRLDGQIFTFWMDKSRFWLHFCPPVLNVAHSRTYIKETRC